MKRGSMGFYLSIVMVVVFLLVTCGLVHCSVNYPQNLWKGIIGEAVGEGYEGMYAVACVYRNRLEKGLPLGCVALRRRDLDEFVRKQGKQYEFMAKDIVRKVFVEDAPDITKGATHYESIFYPKPNWADRMQIVLKIRNHIFYKENNK